MPRSFDNLDAFSDAVGEELGTSDWFTVTQKRSTPSPKPPETTSGSTWTPNARPMGPFGGTIAHGYLTLALVPVLLESAFEVKAWPWASTTARTRCASPARCRSTPGSVLRDAARGREIPVGSQIVVSTVVEREGGDKPVCIADIVYVWSGAPEPGQSDGEAG